MDFLKEMRLYHMRKRKVSNWLSIILTTMKSEADSKSRSKKLSLIKRKMIISLDKPRSSP